MIQGIGCDVVNIDRVSELYKKHNINFIKRILSSDEIEIYNSLNSENDSKLRYLAKRFAAKESFSKALGTGIGKVEFSEISVLNNEQGKPYIVISDKIRSLIGDNAKINISISDDYPVAVAFTIISL